MQQARARRAVAAPPPPALPHQGGEGSRGVSANTSQDMKKHPPTVPLLEPAIYGGT